MKKYILIIASLTILTNSTLADDKCAQFKTFLQHKQLKECQATHVISKEKKSTTEKIDNLKSTPKKILDKSKSILNKITGVSK